MLRTNNVPNSPSSSRVSCDWQKLREQLLAQWTQLSSKELEDTGPNRHRIALLVERKYGVACELVENYLLNFERTMPLAVRQ